MKVPVIKTSLTNKKIMNNSIYSLVFTSIILLGCAQPITHKLNIDIKNNNLCIYTDNTKIFQAMIVIMLFLLENITQQNNSEVSIIKSIRTKNFQLVKMIVYQYHHMFLKKIKYIESI